MKLNAKIKDFKQQGTQKGNPKTLTPRSADLHYGPGPRTTYGPVHGLPPRTPSTDPPPPPKENNNNK